MAKDSKGLKHLTRYWRCVLKKPLDASLVAITSPTEFQGFLNWCSESSSGEKIQSISKSFIICDEEGNEIDSSAFKYC